jgi:hypothetical protein
MATPSKGVQESPQNLFLRSQVSPEMLSKKGKISGYVFLTAFDAGLLAYQRSSGL